MPGPSCRAHILAGLPQNAFAGEVPRVPLRSAAAPDCDGGLRQRASLGPADHRSWPHTCKLISPIYVKPFLRRQKNDSNDAAANVEAAQRPTMRFLAVKSEEAQADAMLFRTRALLVHQRTQTINSLRGQLAEFGVIAPPR